MTKAFAGVRIVEFAQVISGPFAAALLGYLGADVIKVEQPGSGDQARKMMDTGPLAAAGVSPLFQGLNAGKRSLTLDLKQPASREVVERLVSRADVVIDNARPGAMARLGYGYDAMRAIREDIIYCAISGYGQEGPRSKDPAYDGAIQAASGMMSVTGNEGEGPMKAGFTVVDNSTALTAAFAIASSLFRRSQTGEGQYLDVSMLDTAISLMTPLVTNYLIGGEEPAQIGNHSLTRQPTGNVFPTAEGYLQVNAITDTQVAAFCRAIGRGDLLEDARFGDGGRPARELAGDARGAHRGAGVTERSRLGDHARGSGSAGIARADGSGGVAAGAAPVPEAADADAEPAGGRRPDVYARQRGVRSHARWSVGAGSSATAGSAHGQRAG
ncbi:MAG: CoA transferase [Dehalococcoidia bacterium]|nr:CoA transferase [Dehalococcoidia bacterium]